MKDGRLSAREAGTLRSACDILNRWCDWEYGERERPTFDPVLDDLEGVAASAAGMIGDFLYGMED